MHRIGWHPLTRRLLIACLTLGVGLMLIACGSDPSDAPKSAVTKPVPQGAQVIAVAEEIFPAGGPNVYGYCSLNRMDTGCPMTVRLQDRLIDTGMPICRCQNGSSTRQIEVETYEGGAIAHVTMYEGRTTYDLIMVLNEDGSLLVDDQTCNGNITSSIYNDPIELC